MWPFTKEIRIRMESLWRGFVVVLVLFATKLDAASSSSVLSSGFASSVLPSISSNTLSTRIQNLTSITNGGLSTAEISSKYGKIRYLCYAYIASYVSQHMLYTNIINVYESHLPVHICRYCFNILSKLCQCSICGIYVIPFRVVIASSDMTWYLSRMEKNHVYFQMLLARKLWPPMRDCIFNYDAWSTFAEYIAILWFQTLYL